MSYPKDHAPRAQDETGRRVAQFVKRYTEEHGYPPTVREIGEHIERSPQVAHKAVRTLIDTGCMTSRDGEPRTYVLTENGKALADETD